MHDQTTVLVVDPDPGIRDAIRNLVVTMNFCCEAFASGQDFLEKSAASRPGCAILEIRIPGISGLEIQERLLEQGSTLPVIFLTSQATVSIAVRAIRAGAMNFLEKPFREHEMWDAIREAVQLDRERRESVAALQQHRTRLSQLSSGERRMLEMIAQGESRERMAHELNVSVRTVDVRRKQLTKKLDCRCFVDLVRFAVSVVGATRGGTGRSGNGFWGKGHPRELEMPSGAVRADDAHEGLSWR